MHTSQAGVGLNSLRVCLLESWASLLYTLKLKEGQKRSHDAHSACNDAWLSWGECTLGAHHHRGRQSLTAVEEITHRLKSTAISIGMYVESHLKNNSLLNIPYSEQC